MNTWLSSSASMYLTHAPFALGIRELNRLLALRIDLPELREIPAGSVLDVGCGDGFWWNLSDTLDEIYGIDISEREVALAQKRLKAQVFDISKGRPFPELKFSKVIGNCSLEHVRDISAALTHLRSAVHEDGKLILFVPSPYWIYQGKVLGTLLRFTPRLSMMISGAINGFFQHWHLYEVSVWESILRNSGWEVIKSYGLGNRRSEFLFRLFLPIALPGFLFKKVFGFYPNRLFRIFPRSFLSPGIRLLQWALASPLVEVNDPSGYEYMVVAKPTARRK